MKARQSLISLCKLKMIKEYYVFFKNSTASTRGVLARYTTGTWVNIGSSVIGSTTVYYWNALRKNIKRKIKNEIRL